MVLMFNRCAQPHVGVAIRVSILSPIIGQVVVDSVRSLCQDSERVLRACPDDFPCLLPPLIDFLVFDEKVRPGRREDQLAAFHSEGGVE